MNQSEFSHVQTSLTHVSLHEEALRLSKNYFKAEVELLDIIQRIDFTKVYRNHGCTSLFQYTVTILKLSESTSYNFINVARKAVQIPELKAEIEMGNLSVSKARKIVPVLNQDDSSITHREWIEKAKTLTSKKLEQEVARVAPKEETPESARFVTEKRRALKLGMDETEFQNLKRAQDLECQRQKKAVSLEDTIVALTKHFLETKDPLVKAERAAKRAQKNMTQTSIKPVVRQAETVLETPPDFFQELHDLSAIQNTDQAERSGMKKYTSTSALKRSPIPARESHLLNLRDQTQCTHIHKTFGRCEQKRWLDVHHIKPISQGGTHELANLTTLCSAHHRQEHL